MVFKVLEGGEFKEIKMENGLETVGLGLHSSISTSRSFELSLIFEASFDVTMSFLRACLAIVITSFSLSILRSKYCHFQLLYFSISSLKSFKNNLTATGLPSIF